MGRFNICFSKTVLKPLIETVLSRPGLVPIVIGTPPPPSPKKIYLKIGKNSLGAFGAPTPRSLKKKPLTLPTRGLTDPHPCEGLAVLK